jgi:hypothetical protein
MGGRPEYNTLSRNSNEQALQLTPREDLSAMRYPIGSRRQENRSVRPNVRPHNFVTFCLYSYVHCRGKGW